jgi:hypothetical protein
MRKSYINRISTALRVRSIGESSPTDYDGWAWTKTLNYHPNIGSNQAQLQNYINKAKQRKEVRIVENKTKQKILHATKYHFIRKT